LFVYNLGNQGHRKSRLKVWPDTNDDVSSFRSRRVQVPAPTGG